MASAPPLETAGLMGFPQPPSYEDATSNLYPQYPQGPVPPPTAFAKLEQPFYPVQIYTSPPSNPVVSVQTVCVQQGVMYRDRPVQLVCPVCSQMVVTQMQYSAGTMTWLASAGLFIFGCVSGCCLIPFCVNELQDVTHYCPSCNSILGVYKRM